MRLEQWLGNTIARRAALASLVFLGALAVPLTLPILSVDVFVRYQKAIGFTPSTGEHQVLGVLPQYYADMFGWREMAERVAAVYWPLTAEDRARAVFLGNNYEELSVNEPAHWVRTLC